MLFLTYMLHAQAHDDGFYKILITASNFEGEVALQKRVFILIIFYFIQALSHVLIEIVLQ